MTHRWIIRQAALLSMGGTTFAFLGFGNCARNSATRDLANDVGTSAIGQVGATVGESVDENANVIVVEPLTAFFQDLFTAWINLNIPDDPTYDTLLAQ